MLKKSNAPHVLGNIKTNNIMLDVVLALFPALLVSVLYFGLNSVLVITTAVASCVMFEYLCSKYWLKDNINSTKNMSAIVTALLLASCLPVNLPIFMVVIGSFVSIVIAKFSFGGIGKNIFNPALAGRIFLFLAFPTYMVSWSKPAFNDFFNNDAYTSATNLELLKYSGIDNSGNLLGRSDLTQNIPSYLDMFLGKMAGSLGEISAIALLLGFLYLLHRKVLTWHIPLTYITTVFLIMFGISNFSDEPLKYNAFIHIISGGLLLGAIFMATDYVTSPMTNRGKIVFGIGCGALTVIIRSFGVYYEGVSFAILIMNATVPFIDKYTSPKPYGEA